MGEAKTRRDLEMARRAMKEAKRRQRMTGINPKWTIHSRLLKGLAAIVLFIPLLMVAFAIEAYRKNEWPWNLQ